MHESWRQAQYLSYRPNLRLGSNFRVEQTRLRQESDSAREAESGPGLMSHWPLVQSIQNLDGFDLATAVLWSIVLFLGIGFATDSLFNRKGMGPYWNAGYAMLGSYLGLCVHDWWLWRFSAFEPGLTITMILAGLATTLLSATAIAML
jgi:hypothetical protein